MVFRIEEARYTLYIETFFLALNSTRWNNIPNIRIIDRPHNAQAIPCIATTRAQWSEYTAQFGLNEELGLSQVNDSNGETWKRTPAPVPQKTARTKLTKMFKPMLMNACPIMYNRDAILVKSKIPKSCLNSADG